MAEERSAGVPYDLLVAIRTNAERVCRTKTLRNRCVVVSLVLHYFLTELGIWSAISCGFYQGMPHCWVTVSEGFIDLTVTQFSRNSQKIVCGRKLPTPYSLRIHAVPENDIVLRHATPHMLQQAERLKRRVGRVMAQPPPDREEPRG